MESSDEELFNSHFSPDNLDKMVNHALLKGQTFPNMERGKKTTRTKEYQLRERTKSSANFTQVSKKINHLEALCKLLCKPVSVSIIKLSVSELQRWTESKSCNDRSQSPLIQQREQRIARHTVRQSSRKRLGSIPPTEKHVIKKTHITDVLTDIKLPYIKVCRIDKILGEVVPSKECQISVQTECMEKSQVELRTPDPNQLRSMSLNANQLHNQCLNDKTSLCNNASSSEHTVDKNESSENDEISGNFTSQHFNRRRTRRVIYDSNDDSSNAEDIILQKKMRLKPVCPENVMGTYIPNDQNTVHEAKYACESETTQKQLFQKFEVSDFAPKLPQQSSYTSEATSLKLDHNVRNNVEKCNASTCAPLELNFACATEDSIPLILEDANSRTVQERIFKSKEIQEPMEKSVPSDKDLIERYKLFKELRVSVIKFNSARNVNDNKYSATERQRLTARNINNSMNTIFSNTGEIRSDLDLSEHSNRYTGSRKFSPSKPTQQILSLNTCCTPNRNMSSKEIQNVTKLPSVNLMKSSSMSSKMEKLRGTSNLKERKACHNLVKRFGNGSEGMSEKDRIQILEQAPVFSMPIDESTLPPSSPYDSDKTLKLSNSVNYSDDSEKYVNILHASSNEIPSLEENISELSTSKLTLIKDLYTESGQKSEKRLIDFRPTILQQDDTTLKPKKVYWIVSHKSAENISGTKSSTKRNSATCHSFTTSPAKYKKPMDKRNSKGCIHKCIVCDSCFNDYSDLRKHLVMHTQKKKNTLSTPSKSSIRMSEQFRATTRRSSESGVALIIQPSEENSGELLMLESVADSSKKRKTKKDTLSKCSPNKNRRKKGLKKASASNRNECTICSQIFPTETDLAAHIFLHTERELQDAYKIAKQKLEGRESERFETKEKVTDNVDNAVDSNVAEKSLESLVPRDSETEPMKSTTLCEEGSKRTESSPQIKLGKEKMSKRDNTKKCFTICNCHNKPGTDDNCLRIEIVHLCHTCRVLFRSMECLETHYHMPEYAACNQNRWSKSPNLFCSTCGMVFSSVQDVRHHLEIHARFKQGCTMEFRCNICKLIFIGIGAQFYIHWSNHTKDPSWIATEQSLPDSIIIAKSTGRDKCYKQSTISSNRSVEGYLQIAEYICHSCKLPFINNAELKDHISICKSPTSGANTSILKDTDVSAQKYSSVKIICSLCDNAFTEGLKFYRHITHDHGFNSEPQFTCVSLTTMKRTFICSLCMNVTENIDEFGDHWLVHCTRNVLFTCTCGEISRNSFNSFLEHAKEHTIEGKVYVPSCTVTYEDTKTICTQCNLGFESPTAYDQHAVIHKSCNDVNPEEDEVAKTKEKLSEASWIACDTNRDKENLIRILEGSDDSEPELVIDLTIQPEACEKSSEKEKIVQTRYTPTRVAVAGTWTPSSERSLPITKTNIANASVENDDRLTSPENVIITEVCHHVTEAATVPALPTNFEVQTSLITVSSPETDGNFRNRNTEISKQSSTNFVENVHNNEGHDTALIQQKETLSALDDVPLVTQSTTSKKQSPPKPRKGFLRVKTLAELTGSAGCSYNAPEKNNEKCKATRNLLTSTESEKIIPEASQYRAPSSSTTPSAARLTTNCLRIKSVTQSDTAVIGSKNAQQLQESINRRAYMSAPVESATSTCYTNLPPYNMARRTTSVPRSLIESNRNMTNNMIANSVNTNMPKSCKSTANRNQPSPSFSNVLYTNDVDYKYKCKYCDYCTNSLADCLLHDLPDPNNTCQKQYLHNKNRSNQTVINNVGNLPAMTTDYRVQNGACHERCQPITINQQMQYPSSPPCNQYPHLPSNSSNGSNYMFQRNHQIIIPNKPLIDNAPSSICYNNSNFPIGGGVMIANNQTHSVQSIPTIGILQQPVQQHMYQAPVCTEPFAIMDPSCVQQQRVYQIFQPKM